jgi:hypothetical protein
MPPCDGQGILQFWDAQRRQLCGRGAAGAPGVRHRTESVRRQRAFERLFVRHEHQVCGFSVSRQRRVDAADFERRSIEVRRLGRTFERPSMIRKSGSQFSEKIQAPPKNESAVVSI